MLDTGRTDGMRRSMGKVRSQGGYTEGGWRVTVYLYSLLALFLRKSLILTARKFKIVNLNWEKVHSATGIILSNFPQNINFRARRDDLFILSAGAGLVTQLLQE